MTEPDAADDVPLFSNGDPRGPERRTAEDRANIVEYVVDNGARVRGIGRSDKPMHAGRLPSIHDDESYRKVPLRVRPPGVPEPRLVQVRGAISVLCAECGCAIYHGAWYWLFPDGRITHRKPKDCRRAAKMAQRKSSGSA